MYSASIAAFTLLLVVESTRRVTEYLESQRFWTPRLRISAVRHWFLLPAIFVIWNLLFYELVFQYPAPLSSFEVPIAAIFIAGTFIIVLSYALPVYHSRVYLRLRWKAWTGPSRTSIAANLVPYIGDRRDWETLDTLARGKVVAHPVERFSRNPFTFRRHLIASDPTDLLKTRTITDQREGQLWTTHSDVKQCIFQPVLANQSVSLLWGERIGFQPRCSRGIISVPTHLFATSPTLYGGLDARGVCLACGILSRNKGLNPASFACNLRSKGSIGAFEENSVFWPRPAKTLRSFFHREFDIYFGLLGPAFVIVATELALLLTDAPLEVTEDWLEGQLEHQDLELNNEAYRLGADPVELGRLYRGHYATMLVSLSAHRIGVRTRPELLVYEATCKSEGVELSAWVMSTSMQERKQRELGELGPRALHLVEAIV